MLTELQKKVLDFESKWQSSIFPKPKKAEVYKELNLDLITYSQILSSLRYSVEAAKYCPGVIHSLINKIDN